MGFWGILILIAGIALIILGFVKRIVIRSIKTLFFLFIIGVALIVVAVFILVPDSLEMVKDFLNI